MNRLPSQRRLFILYAMGLRFFPRDFRLKYQDPMLQSLRDLRADRGPLTLREILSLFADLLHAGCRERLRMTSDHYRQRPIVFHAFALALLLTLFGAVGALTMQQMLRRAADQPQIQMVQGLSEEITRGVAPDDAIPRAYVDPSRSLEPFVVYYDDNGIPQYGTGYLDQSLPAPPRGIFEYIRNHGSDKFTWQPLPRVRIAAFAQRVPGGYLLAGRSLSLVEADESLLRRGTILGWLFLMASIAASTALVQRAQRRFAHPTL